MNLTTTQKLCNELRQRREMGLQKYGTTLQDAGLTHRQLLQHAKEEALDLAEYCQAMIDKIDAVPEWPSEDRIEAIGQNGNTGAHYAEVKDSGVYNT